MSDELKPCPGCSNTGTLSLFYDVSAVFPLRRWGVTCNDCSEQVLGLPSRADVIAAWNRSAELPADPIPHRGVPIDAEGRDRITQALADLEAAWRRSPDLRLGQMVHVAGCKRGQADAFYIEDREMIQQLKALGDSGGKL